MGNHTKFFSKDTDTLAQIREARAALEEIEDALQKKIDRQNASPQKSTGFKTVEGAYDPETNTLYVNAYEHQYLPSFLKYLLQYLKLPADTKIEFKQ